MRKKRVAHIITRLTVGGAQENTIYTFLNHDVEKYDAFLICGADDSYGGRKYWEKLRINPNVIILDALQNQINLLRDIKTLLQIYILLRRNKIDIVHTHSSKAGVLGRLAAKAAGVPVIVHTVHGWSFHNNMSNIKKRIYILIERFAARLCHRLITVTRLDVDKGLKAGIGSRNKYVTIRSGVDFKSFTGFNKEKVDNVRSLFEGKKIVGTIGRLSEQKNISDFIKIAAKLRENHKDLHFLILGDGPQREQIEDLINNMGLGGHVTLMGVRHDVKDLIHTFDVLLLTSLWEGLPRVIPEAMYCGIPVVANAVDGVNEIIEDGVNGLSTVPHSVDDACSSVERILEDKELRRIIIDNAYKTVYPEYAAKFMVHQIEGLYSELMK